MENTENDLRGMNKDGHKAASTEEMVVVPVIKEQLVISKEQIETGKVRIQKRVTEEHVSVNIPVVQEGYHIERRPGNKELLTEPPPVRYEGENIIIPVIREVLVVQKHYEVIEEVHVIKTKAETPHQEEVILRKETVEVQRTNSTQ